MANKTATRKRTKKLPVIWAGDAGFKIMPKQVPAGRPRLLKSCTISITPRKPIPLVAPQSAVSEA